MINIRRFGSITTLAAAEALVSLRPYNEPNGELRRSIVSTSATDSNALATGARIVRITYLNSAWELKTEDVPLNGLTPVATGPNDLRYIESVDVIRGVSAVGDIKLMATAGGGGAEICVIPAGFTQAMLCHHYVPAGMQCFIANWGATSDDRTAMRLLGQSITPPFLAVDRIIDLERMIAGSAFTRQLQGAVVLPAQTYMRINTHPGQATATNVSAWLNLYEVPSGS